MHVSPHALPLEQILQHTWCCFGELKDAASDALGESFGVTRSVSARAPFENRLITISTVRIVFMMCTPVEETQGAQQIPFHRGRM
jgi:hypothetical protein